MRKYKTIKKGNNMAYKLSKGKYRVTCKYPGCTFDHEFTLTQTIMGMTEEDVESEAKKFARDMARVKHDAIHGAKHTLTNPTVRKISGVYEAVGAQSSVLKRQSDAVRYQEYKKGDKILNKGDLATTVCEVVKGSAGVDRANAQPYKPGESFGAAALLVNQVRTADVIALEDNTMIAFYNLKELSKKDPRKAKELYSEAMEDMFSVIQTLETTVSDLENELEKTKIASENRKARVAELEEQLLKYEKQMEEINGRDSFK